MPSPPVLDLEPLLAPIPGDEPAGSAVPLPLREELDVARKNIDPADFDANDPGRPTEAKRAEWGRIIELTQETLVSSSKDLMMVARLTEALTKTQGFAGLRDGFSLFRRLFDECWDRVRPVIEEPDDLEARAAALNWLDDSERGARFPLTVRQVPLITGAKGRYSWMDWNLSRTGKGGITVEDFEQAIASSTRESCQLAFDDIEETIEVLQGLFETLNEKMGNVAPGLTMVRQAIFECRTLAKQILDRKGPVEQAGGEDAESSQGEAGGNGSDEGPSVGRSINSRAQVYRRLAEAADVLQQLEPHSPIPYLIRRAVALGDLPFPELIKALIPNQEVRYDLSRNLGIQELQE
jgi:type VI secretion system protein ImpA